MVKYDRNEDWELRDGFEKQEILHFIKKAKEVLNSMRSAYKKEKAKYSGLAVRHMTLLLLLKQLLDESYRGIVAFVENHSEVQDAIGLKKVPHYGYLQQVSKKIDDEFFEEFFKEFRKRHEELELAADATGFSTKHGSSYYTQKVEGQTEIDDYIQLHAMTDVNTQIIVDARLTGGRRHESPVFEKMLKRLPKQLEIGYITADKAYDAEKHHRTIQTKFKAQSVIKPREKDGKPPKGFNKRREAWYNFYKPEYKEKYGKRSLIETTFSTLKRVFNTALKARKWATQQTELLLRIIAYNIRRLAQLEHLGKI